MKPPSVARPIAFALLLVTLVLGRVLGAEPKLFEPVGDGADLTEEQQHLLANLRAAKETESVEVTRMNPAALNAKTLNFNIAPDKEHTGISGKFVTTAPSAGTWVSDGNSPLKNSLLTVRGDNVTGTVQTEEGVYKIVPLGGGVHAVVKQDLSKLSPDEPPDAQPKERMPSTAPATTRRAKQPEDATLFLAPPATNQLDLLVVYTPAARKKTADIEGLVEHAVVEANIAFSNSNTHLVARLVGSKQTDYVESGSFKIDLQRLQEVDDGFMDEVHKLRDSVKADLVVLLIDNSSYGGTSAAILADASSAFAVVDQGHAIGPSYSFTHEIGHLLGARHDLANDNKTTPFPFCHGFINNQKHWRTAMAYDGVPSSIRMLYWSDPSVSFEGDVMGTTADCNVAEVLRRTGATAAGFR